MESVKKSIDKRALHKREKHGTESGESKKEQDTSSRSGNDANADDADIRPIYDEEPIAKKCIFNANHDACVTKFLNEVNSRAKVPSHKTTNRNKPEKQISVAKKPKRHIPTGHRFSIKKTSVVHEKTKTPRSCLRWKPTSRILKTVGLRWVPTGKIFTSSRTKVESEPPHGSNADITHHHECIQTLDSSAGTSINVQEEQTLDVNAYTPFNLKKERIKVWIKENVISGRPRLHGTDSPSETKLRGRLLGSFQDDTKYEHVGQDTRSQGGKDDQDKQGKDLDISKSKDNDKVSRSEITQHEGTSLQHNKDQIFKNSTIKQSQQVQGNKIQDLTSRIQRPHIKGDC
ncbi:hypothetical protein Tco_0570766 [Tanacetum coccineum]